MEVDRHLGVGSRDHIIKNFFFPRDQLFGTIIGVKEKAFRFIIKMFNNIIRKLLGFVDPLFFECDLVQRDQSINDEGVVL